MPGFVQVEPGDFDALAAAVDDETAGIIMEPIQGEGGINVYPDGLRRSRCGSLCDQRRLTLIFDEVWTGCGRTGKWFAHQHFRDRRDRRVEPDIMTLGKAVGGGLPVGVMFARPEVAPLLVPGKHGCTLGGNPICMAVARTIFDVIEREKLLEHAADARASTRWRGWRASRRLKAKIAAGARRGLMLGIELKSRRRSWWRRRWTRGL